MSLENVVASLIGVLLGSYALARGFQTFRRKNVQSLSPDSARHPWDEPLSAADRARLLLSFSGRQQGGLALQIDHERGILDSRNPPRQVSLYALARAFSSEAPAGDAGLWLAAFLEDSRPGSLFLGEDWLESIDGMNRTEFAETTCDALTSTFAEGFFHYNLDERRGLLEIAVTTQRDPDRATSAENEWWIDLRRVAEHYLARRAVEGTGPPVEILRRILREMLAENLTGGCWLKDPASPLEKGIVRASTERQK